MTPRRPENAETAEVAIRRALEEGLGAEDIAARSPDWKCGAISLNLARVWIGHWRRTGALKTIVRA